MSRAMERAKIHTTKDKSTPEASIHNGPSQVATAVHDSPLTSVPHPSKNKPLPQAKSETKTRNYGPAKLATNLSINNDSISSGGARQVPTDGSDHILGE